MENAQEKFFFCSRCIAMNTVRKKKSMTTQQRPFPAFIKNPIPKDTFIPMSACHPVLTAESSPYLLPGTAFHLLMGVQKQPMVWGVYLSPTQWYVDGISRPRVVSVDDTHFDFKAYPGSHIPQTKSPELWATMCISCIEDNKKFNKMVKNIDPRILEEIHRHCIPEPPPPPASQFFDVGTKIKCKYECRVCQRGFASSDGFKRHVCRKEGEMFCCDFCVMQYTSLTWRDKHVATVHGGRTTRVQEQPERSPLPITAPSPFRFEYYGTAIPPVEVDAPVPAAVADDDDEDLSLTGGAIAASPFTVIDCTSYGRMPRPSSAHAPAEQVVLPHRPMIYDEIPDDEEGLNGTGILAIAHTWDIGQEFVMFYKEKDEGAEEYEAHGMLLRWDVTDESPGPVVCYLRDGDSKKKRNKHHYHEEHMDCTSDFVVLRLVPLDPTTVFDPKRRKMNQSTKPE